MKACFSIVSGLVFGLLSPLGAAAETPGEEPTVIPLDQVWADKMPDTRNIQELEKNNPGRSLVAEIGEASINRLEDLKRTDMPRAGFAVAGTGLEALRAAHEVMVKKKQPQATFKPDEQITVVYFCEPVGDTRVRIRSVSLQKSTITIQYELDQILGGGNGSNFALIPLGKLAPGKYRVEMTQVVTGKPSDNPRFKPMSLSPKWAREFQCQPFEFRIAET